MSKVQKLLLILIGGPVLMIVLLLLTFMLFIDSAARKAVEGGTTHALGVPTTLNSASIWILPGKK